MDLEVVGRHALLFDDDAASAFVNSGDALVDWNSLKIDRYDVRNLLTSPPPPRRRGRGGGSDDIEEEINRERYLDLPSHSDQQDLEVIENQPETVGYRSVGFSYGNVDDSSNLKSNDSSVETSRFTPPFPVPEYLQCMPPSQKLHQIIARTATFVCRHGGQSEIVLRVKQGDNPTFGFLMPGHELHPYFRYLVDHPELLHSEHEANLQEERKKHGENENSKGGDGALSLLGSVYGSGEDEEGDNHAETKQHLAEGGGNAGSDTIPLGSKKIESAEAHIVKDESGFKTTILSNKEKVLNVRENASIVTSGSGSGNVVDEKSSSSHAAGDKPINSIAGVEPLIIEPPSETKILIDKLVEFVARNGKLFESNLIAQDSKHGRFPFLVPSNPYHAYYLKALQAAQECILNGKSSSSGREELVVHGKDKKAYEKDYLGDMPPESDRKEKFKMVIRKSKDTQETEPKETQQESAVTVDAASAAAILQAAIRGIKPFPTGSSAHDGSDKSGQSGSAEAPKSITRAASVEADSSEAQLTREKNRKAERLKRAKMFVAMLKTGAVPFKAGASRSSSMEPLEHGVARSENDRDHVDGEDEREGRLAPADADKPATVEELERNYFGEEDNVRLRNRKYRTRSEACEDDSEVADVDHMEGDGHHRKRKHRSKYRKEGENREDEQVLESEKRHRKRRHMAHSSNSVESEGKGDGSEEDRSHKHHKSRRRYDHSPSDEDGHEKDKCHKSSRKKHRSHHSSHRHSGKRRSSKHDSHREDESVEEERDERHHRKKGLSSRDKHTSKKKNSSRDHRSSDDDENQNRDNLVKYRRGSRGAVKEGEIGSQVSEESKRVDMNDREASVTSQQRALASQPSEPNAEIPEDLRAKIRAMLMATRL